MMPKTRTMYMHTLDSQPASFENNIDSGGGAHVFFVGGRYRARLVPTLTQLRQEQRAAMREAAKTPYTAHWADRKRYGYVLVEVPA